MHISKEKNVIGIMHVHAIDWIYKIWFTSRPPLKTITIENILI